MSKVKVGINGMGRIGRTVLREWINRNIAEIEIVAVNNPGKAERYVHLLKYDSVHGRFQADVSFEGQVLQINDHKIQFFNEKNPENIPWSDHGVQVVIDGTGVFRDGQSLGKHLGGSVQKVILCAPGDDIDGTFVMGINNDQYDSSKHHIISNASCTTNCLAPIAKVLNDHFEIESGHMTTVHAYTSDQNILDAAHKDMRRARTAATSMIPTTTGAAKALGQVIPSLEGKLDGHAVRVPTANVSLVDLKVTVKKQTTKEEVNKAFEKASKEYLKNILGYTEEELVSIDYVGLRESSMLDAKLTNVINGNLICVTSWYDNEAGFSNRVLDLAKFVGEKL